MPLRKSWSRSILTVAIGAPLAAAGAATPASAVTLPSAASQNLTCAAQALSQPLSKFGDTASYWLAPGGDFETGSTGWTLQNSAVVSGNETLGVLPGSHSLKLGTSIGTAKATTPPFCVDPLHPHFRFLTKVNSLSAVVNTDINFRTALGATLTVPAKVNTLNYGSWAVSDSQPLSTAIPSVFLGSGTTASITFTSNVASLGGSVVIDDLLIDPYRRG